MTVPRAACLAASAAALLLLPTAAQAKSRTKTVDMGVPAASQDQFNKLGADVNDFFPHSITIRVGDRIRFRPVGFHSVDIPKRGRAPLPLITPTGKTIAGVNDADGKAFWFNGRPELNLNPALAVPLFGKHVTYKNKRIESGLPLGPTTPPPFTVRFKKKGTYTYYCNVHPGMTGKIHVKRKNAKVPTAKQDRKRVKAQLKRDRNRAKGLATSTGPTGNTVYVGGSTNGGVEFFGMLPATKTVKAGTTVRFMMSPKSFEVHTASFGPGNPDQDATSYLGVIAASFQGAQVDQRGVYPSEQPPTVADYSSSLHGNGFWNSGVMDNGAATPPASYNDVKFTAPGTYDYYCLIHTFMHGQVVVTP
jgi:plastocyanin